MSKTLVITSSYLPHQIVPLNRALTMIFCGKIDSVEEYLPEQIGTVRASLMGEFPQVCEAYGRTVGDGLGDLIIYAPVVARMTRGVPYMKRGAKFSRANVFTRDGYRCQYCRNMFSASALNFDHVIPRCQGGKTVWENIVTSCIPCNSKKAYRTPEEAKMPVLKMPVKPKWLPMMGPKFSPQDVNPSWIPYLGSAFDRTNESAA